MRQDAPPSPVMKRLMALIHAGYRIQEQDFGDADNNHICLQHPAHWQKVKEKSLYLYDEGSVMGGTRLDNTCLLIEPDKTTEFERLIAATPKPTWWERNSESFYTIGALMVIGAIMLAGASLTTFVWDAFFGR